jgi:rRNA processing protein Gar1
MTTILLRLRHRISKIEDIIGEIKAIYGFFM